MDIVYTIRMKEDLMRKLDVLAKMTQRSRAGVIRWLVIQASDPRFDGVPDLSPNLAGVAYGEEKILVSGSRPLSIR